MRAATLIKELESQTLENLKKAEEIAQLNHQQLTWRENEQKWNILECVEHLNRYGNYYLPLIEQKLNTAEKSTNKDFNTGWLGNYFAKSMLPKEKLNKMNTFKDKNPLNEPLETNVINTFIQQQKTTLELLKLSEDVDLNKIKIEISIATFIKLKLGDIFRVVIYHNIRHLKQIENILQQAKKMS